MRAIPVLDVRGGRAVHATGGARADYRPLRSVLAAGDDPVALARAFRRTLGTRECYVADLDAIEGGPPDLATLRGIAAAGLEVWVDAGTTESGRAGEVVAAGAWRVVVGLETLLRADLLDAIAAAPGVTADDRLIFGLDLRDGRPVTPATADLAAADWVERAAHAGFRTILVLDLARVGTMAGPPFEMIRELHDRFPDLDLVAGGGVRDAADLRRLAAHGCAGALVGTAIHSGTITRADIDSLEAL